MWLRNSISRFLFFAVKLFSLVFYRTQVKWITPSSPHWDDKIKLFVFLNHTSLFEPLFVSAVPNHFIWWGAPRLVVPGADKTLKRPLVGTFFKLLAPKMISITRKRDETWDYFLGVIVPDSLVVILPEGRMMRRGGLDKEGQPMTVRGGIADILEMLEDGDMLIGYSGGLHHVQYPGQWFPKLFKTISIKFERLSIAKYKEDIRSRSGKSDFKITVVQDLEQRMKMYV